MLLGRRHQARGVDLKLRANQQQGVLETLAFEMMSAGVAEIAKGDAIERISDQIVLIAPDMSASDFLINVEQVSGLLVEREREVYAFAHLTFQEYLAACFISNNALEAKLVDSILSAWWREVILLYSAMGNASNIIRKCLDHAGQFESLALAGRSLAEARQIDPDIRRLVDDHLNPTNVRDDPESRAAVGKARLRMRIGAEHAVGTNSFLATTPITWIEYQAFIDGQDEPESCIPDWWLNPIYNDGEDLAPVAGIRRTDAIRFCEWMTNEFSPDLRCSLPLAHEIVEGANVLGLGLASESRTFWTASAIEPGQDRRFFPIFALTRRDGFPRLRRLTDTPRRPPTFERASMIFSLTWKD